MKPVPLCRQRSLGCRSVGQSRVYHLYCPPSHTGGGLDIPPGVLGSPATEAGVSIYGQGPDARRRVPFITWYCPPGAARRGAGATQTAAVLIPSLNHL